MKCQDILDFWFSDRVKEKWWDKDPEFDKEIHEKFFKIYHRVLQVEMRNWEHYPKSTLALIILMDQMPRNMFRGKPESFVTDAYALDLCKKAIIRGFPEKYSTEEKMFLYMPLMHSENIHDQEFCVDLFAAEPELKLNHKYALAHKEVIEKFGRFPHRNKILGRKNTPEEEIYLQDPNAGF